MLEMQCLMRLTSFIEVIRRIRTVEKRCTDMSKAVLVMDMPEQVCQKCTLCYETENDDEYLCCATGKLVPDGEKPDWCPLRELPEKSAHPEHCDNGRFDAGWNGCLDAIEGGAHGKEQSE